jgi:hypothetical protein
MVDLLTNPNPQLTKATAQIEAFKSRFGEEHLHLAYHLAFPLTFTKYLGKINYTFFY